jgi:hypothetical protein
MLRDIIGGFVVRFIRLAVVCAVVTLGGSAMAEQRLEVFVAPTGDDANIGSRQAPLKTISAAIKKVRSLRKRVEGKKYIVGGIYLRKGVYHPVSGIILEKKDSGTASAPLFIRAWNHERVVISGGKRFGIDELIPVSAPAVKARLKPSIRKKVYELDISRWLKDSKPWPKSFKGYAGWPEVYVNDVPMHLSRWPNDGYAKIAKVIDKGSVPRYGDKSNRGGSFNYSEGEPSKWSSDAEVYLNGYWCYKWADQVLKVASIDADKKIIKLDVPHTYGIGGPSGGLYYAVNLVEELDREGEYVFDRKRGKLYLLLPQKAAGRPVSEIAVAMARKPLLKISGASYIRLSGIFFEDTLGDGATIHNCRNVMLEGCTFKNISSTAVSINGGEKCGIRNSEIFNIGKTGVSLSGGGRKTLQASGHYAVDNHIHHYARLVKTYAPAVKLSGVGQVVANNYMHDAPHNAVLFGGNLHLIEYNRIERVCLDTADAGAIYCGRDWSLSGNIIQKNWIASLGAAEHHNNWGIYLDDVASGITVHENVMVDCPSGILVGGGRNNTITDNLFVRCKSRAYLYYDDRGTKGKRKVPMLKDDPKMKSTMWSRMKHIPYHKEPWKSRFPYLAALDKDDNPGAPKNAVVTGNIAFNSAPIHISELTTKFGKVENNTSIKDDLKIALKNGKVSFEHKDERLCKYTTFRVGPR